MPETAQAAFYATNTFWALVSLLLFVAITIYYNVPSRVVKALDARADRIRQDLDEARQLREEAQSVLADYQRKRRAAEAEAAEIVEEAKREAQRIAEDAKRKLDEMVERRTASAEAKIARAEEQAVADVRDRATSLAIEASRVLIADHMNRETADRIVDNSIDAVRTRLS